MMDLAAFAIKMLVEEETVRIIHLMLSEGQDFPS
jgi:hypothetical protein